MPLYEYRCRECDHLEEVLQKVSDPAPVSCPSCGKEHTMAKEVSLTSFQLKGGGWYKDLYSSVPADKGKTESASGNASGGESKKAKEPASSSSTTSASAPASSSTSSSTSSSSASSSSTTSSSPTKPSGSPKAA